MSWWAASPSVRRGPARYGALKRSSSYGARVNARSQNSSGLRRAKLLTQRLGSSGTLPTRLRMAPINRPTQRPGRLLWQGRRDDVQTRRTGRREGCVQKNVIEQGWGRLLPVKRPSTRQLRGRGRPCRVLKRARRGDFPQFFVDAE